MEATQVRTGNYGEIISGVTGREVVYYSQFGSYQGIWLLVTKDGDNYYIYKDYYGSCSGCDPLQSEIRTSEIDLEIAKKFADKYHPFLTLSDGQLEALLHSQNLKSLFPKNIRMYDDKDRKSVV